MKSRTKASIVINKSKSTERVETYRERQESMGRKRRAEKYLTDEEHEFLNRILKEYRAATR